MGILKTFKLPIPFLFWLIETKSFFCAIGLVKVSLYFLIYLVFNLHRAKKKRRKYNCQSIETKLFSFVVVAVYGCVRWHDKDVEWSNISCVQLLLSSCCHNKCNLIPGIFLVAYMCLQHTHAHAYIVIPKSWQHETLCSSFTSKISPGNEGVYKIKIL